MTQDELKKLVAKAAVQEILNLLPEHSLLGMGTGSTVNFLIDELKEYANYFSGVVSSSDATSQRLLSNGFKVLDANTVQSLPLYIDGADEIDPDGNMLKGGGGALTREKIVASLASQFICICDATKLVPVLGQFPLPVEVIPMASAQIQRVLEALGGQVRIRNSKVDPNLPFVTDNQGWILDVKGLAIENPLALETKLNQIPGVICNGIFAIQSANMLLVSAIDQVQKTIFK
ncbi:ribose-5-phosphate isomerase RpiA [Polynucleobacter kasalickyi]|uniref:Ribose-5-phosphate isomerase A n=1 Tax=Polynucleobacter kasalickyi TaxID=1938817 RepID=A0A1W2B180_9BURK|nr:ribose-5-phosphate isomerase RpiA [Polynucleobacter kasalickyi]SMC66723.1 ribose-5-phosphate isomerase [Polynucleobacter kasalickyi]